LSNAAASPDARMNINARGQTARMKDGYVADTYAYVRVAKKRGLENVHFEL